MPNLFLVMLGGAVGAGARHLVGRATLAWWGPGYPWGTLAVNVLGGFAMGLLVGNLSRFGNGGETWRLLLGVGVLGGFTTFSAFSLDVVLMMERGALPMALGYILISVLGALVALMAGLSLTRAVA
ncbi:fluoride efflux transporter CrcB [Sphingomonas sp. S2-65]|uniref:fluoride efflux transporter CrcB n=1 Tax=Sphingomonas sp. S2-65 TaxID=2903960 RepID=UPI001F21DF7F|nr:fluoride efflux transporter CrcB [Sphingomonas sp. S2-65]UYY58284.1 fluoride efflux transporter CrcB [Sphingomonas sp. S2-65]